MKSVEAVAFSPNSNFLCSGSWDKTAILWDVQVTFVKRFFNVDLKIYVKFGELKPKTWGDQMFKITLLNYLLFAHKINYIFLEWTNEKNLDWS